MDIPTKETTSLAGDIQPHAILDLQRSAIQRDRAPTLERRRNSLKKLRRLLTENRSAFEAAVASDFGNRSHHETAMLELVPTVEGINYLLRNLRRFMRPERRGVAAVFRMGSTRVEYQPLGVVGVISPWNYPVNLTLMPLATALAAGNRVMIKPSELTPNTSELMRKLLAGVFEQEEVSVITGGADVAKSFSSLPLDHLMFTGSTNVGRAVMRAASENLVPVTLELGGKSPVVIARGQVDETAARRIAFGKLANGGQTCVAPDYALVHEDDLETFVAAFGAATKRLYPAGPTSKDYSSIINDAHFQRLSDLMSDAAGKGAKIIAVGHNADSAAERSLTIAPTIITNVSDEMSVMRDEIFGPLLPVVTYSSIDEAIGFINARPRPLALYYFGADDDEREQVLTRTTSGNVGINTTVLHVAQDDLPFGGVGESGMGAYHGVEGFRRFSHAKGIYDQGRWNIADLGKPPFGKVADWLLKFILK